MKSHGRWFALCAVGVSAVANTALPLSTHGHIETGIGVKTHENATLAKSGSISKAQPDIVNFGYNKFVKSPYSGKMAVKKLDSREGIRRFQQSEHKTAFFKLCPHYAPQQDINSCGIASAVIILNTVYANSDRTPPLSAKGSWYVPEENTLYGQFVWTEDNFYNKRVAHIVNKKVLEGDQKVHGQYHPGIELNRLALVLNRQLPSLKAKAYHVTSAHKVDVEAFRQLLKEILSVPSKYMLVNYDLNLYAAQGGGHISPVGAYDQKSDSVLIIDTWSASNTWIWVQLEDLYKSMHTMDGTTYRGYILVHAENHGA